ncbi:hypothetical protein N7462_008439 [Penicillium macrosclerotiorum]|uniref:uncharacterized protein n=1 Tax=Penicillium macrosclerotiorum TaxID=303699 RepID=UPI002546C0D3|nr:uncharacterized protein N7462_008439 [Penicillium macrosclerotiorum]KAJ5675542.1 hypothetical protein N7462_008439 [Penicillium macrosclerotiorum]
MPFAQSLLTNTAVPASERQDALNRIHADPGIPQETTTSSFWLQKPHPDFAQRSSKRLPPSADVVIIGSGITGASIARTLLQNRAPSASPTPSHPAVVMLEARDICSGATGRNGGHILETADEYAELADVFGEDVARKTLRFRLAHLREILNVAEELGLTEEAQARKVRFLSAFFGEQPWKEALERLRRFKNGMPEESAEWVAYEGDAIPEEFKLSRATGIVAGPAGALWPYKFVTGVLSKLLEDYPNEFRVEDHAAVKLIQSDLTSNQPYRIETSRGTISAKHVIHCTNAHVGHLVPGLRGRIFPLRGQMSAQTPGDQFPLQAAKHSWLFTYERGFDYLTQLPEGQMMFGGGFANSEGGGVADLGIATDNDMSLYIDIHLSGALSAVFGHKSWGRVHGDQIQAMWTGNMGFSADGFPWVGQLPSSMTQRAGPTSPAGGAEWACAAFGGEGMVQAWLCGKALATMLLTKGGQLAATANADLSWFPEQMLISEKRIAEAQLPKNVVDSNRHSNL